MRLSIWVVLLIVGCAERPAPTTPPQTALRLTEHPDRLTVTAGGRPVLTYHLTEAGADTLPDYYRRSGFIDSVYSPAGQLVTDGFPVDYTHQHGIFTAWTNTTFRGQPLDFWNQHRELGTVRHQELLEVIRTDTVVGFRARLQQISLTEGPVLDEFWHVRVRRQPTGGAYVWDLRSEQLNITNDTLYLNRHLYGGLGVRGAAVWNHADSLHFRGPARFATDASLTRNLPDTALNHTRPPWVALYGALADGDTAGIAVLPHPDNFRAPQFVRVHPTMPYLSVTPVVEQGFALAPGQRYLSRYRFVVFDGPPRPEVVEGRGVGW